MARGTGGRLRDLQKQAGIDLVKAAARAILLTKDYRNVSMDEIAKAAGVSRTTLYAYFPSKGDLLFSFLADDMAEQIAIYEELSRIGKVTRATILEWLYAFRQFYDRYRAEIPLFAEAFRDKPELSYQVEAHRDRAIAILGTRFASFDVESGTPQERARRRAQAHLMIVMIEQVAVVFAVSQTSPDLGEGAGVIADMLFAFIENGSLTGK